VSCGIVMPIVPIAYQITQDSYDVSYGAVAEPLLLSSDAGKICRQKLGRPGVSRRERREGFFVAVARTGDSLGMSGYRCRYRSAK
jgi:hypothetical protein